MGGALGTGLMEGLAQGMQQGRQGVLMKRKYDQGKELRDEQIKKLKADDKFEDDLFARDQDAWWAYKTGAKPSKADELGDILERLGMKPLGGAAAPAAAPPQDLDTGQSLGAPDLGQPRAAPAAPSLSLPGTAPGSIAGLSPQDIARGFLKKEFGAEPPKTFPFTEVDPETGTTVAGRQTEGGVVTTPPRITKLQNDGFGSTEFERHLALVAKEEGTTVGDMPKERRLSELRQWAAAGLSQEAVLSRKDAEAVADSVEAGIMPVDATLMGRKNVGAIMGDLARREFDVTRGAQEWQGVKAWISTVNNPRNTSLRQAMNFAGQQLDLLDEKVKDLDAGQLMLWNKATYRAALEGARGPKWQEKATQVEQVISDLVSQLAVIYQGGGVPTESAWEQARRNLNEHWEKETLLSATKTQRRTLALRQQAITDVLPITKPPAGTRAGGTGAAITFDPTTGKFSDE